MRSISACTASRPSADRVCPTGMDHLGAMLNGNLDDLVASEISTNGGVLSTLANDVRLIGLCFPSISNCGCDCIARQPGRRRWPRLDRRRDIEGG